MMALLYRTAKGRHCIEQSLDTAATEETLLALH